LAATRSRYPKASATAGSCELRIARRSDSSPSPKAAKIIDGVEELIEQADESNDALVTDEQKVTDRLAADASATATRGKRLVLIVLALATLLTALVSLAMARPLVRAARRLLTAARGIAAGDLAQNVDVAVAGELGATAAAFGDMVTYLREVEQAAERIADGDLTTEIEPKSE
jgi:HAMP domain-containing protein